ncbi:MAG: DUF4383 domain-containing protein [Patescibacteria group bacterium]
MAKTLAIVFGIVFVLVGVLGFIPNGIVGAMGIFETNTLHDLVHLLVGIILLAVAFTAPMKSALWLKILGAVYLVLAVLGFLMIPSGGMLLGLVQMNATDHLLHAVLGIVLIAAGAMGGGSKPAMMPGSAM